MGIYKIAGEGQTQIQVILPWKKLVEVLLVQCPSRIADPGLGSSDFNGKIIKTVCCIGSFTEM